MYDAGTLPPPVLRTTTSPRIWVKMYERLERATADVRSPLGAYLAGLRSDEALRLLNAVHLCLFGDALAAPPDEAFIQQRMRAARVKVLAAKREGR